MSGASSELKRTQKPNGAEMKSPDEQEWAVSPTEGTALPLLFPVGWRGTNGRRWHSIGH